MLDNLWGKLGGTVLATIGQLHLLFAHTSMTIMCPRSGARGESVASSLERPTVYTTIGLPLHSRRLHGSPR